MVVVGVVNLFSLVLCFGSLGLKSTAVFAGVGSSKSDRIELAPNQAERNAIHAYARFGLEHRGEESLLGWAGIDPGTHSDIVIFNFSRFFGDNMIFYFSLIETLRERYPGSRLKIISPTADVFANGEGHDFEWSPFHLTFSQHQKSRDRIDAIRRLRDRMAGFINDHVPRGAFVLFDLTTLDKADAELHRAVPDEIPPSNEFRLKMKQVGATAVGISMLYRERIFGGLTAIELMSPAPASRLVDSGRMQTFSTRLGPVTSFVLREQMRFTEPTIYGIWLENISFLFGSGMFLSWHSANYTHPRDLARVRDLLGAQELDSGRRYGFLNLNTWGGDKVRDFTPHYAQLLRDLVEPTLREYPDLNLIVRFPETQFGPDVQAEALALANAHPGRVALHSSSSLELVPHILAQAMWVITYDSGLTHLAAFLPADQVLTIGLPSSGADFWRKPDQTYIKLDAGEPMLRLVEHARAWIAGRMECARVLE